MRYCISPIAAHRPTRLRRTGTIPSTASIFWPNAGRSTACFKSPSNHGTTLRAEPEDGRAVSWSFGVRVRWCRGARAHDGEMISSDRTIVGYRVGQLTRSVATEPSFSAYCGRPFFSVSVFGASLLLSRAASSSCFFLNASYSGVPGRGGNPFG